MNNALTFAFSRQLTKQLYIFFLVSFASYPNDHVIAQGYIGIRLTPNFTAEPKVFNNSPATISTGTTTAIEAGLDYTYMLNRKWGISAGTDFGGGNWSYNLKAPLAAFGSGSGQVNLSRFHNYLYNSGTLNAVFKISALGNDIRMFAGPTFRFQHSQRVSTSRRRDNKDSNYMYANDPGTGSITPDFLLVYPNKARLITIMSAGIGYEHTVNQNLDVLLGLRTNWGITSTSKSVMTLNMNGQLYKGSINTSSNYIGFDIALRFKTAAKTSKRKS